MRYEATDTAATLALDLAAAWPAEASLARWQRTIQLQRGTAIVITDDYQLTAVREPTVFNFITSRPVDLATPGRLVLAADSVRPGSRAAVLAYDSTALIAAVDTVEITDPQLRLNWTRVHRIRLTERARLLQARREFYLTPA